MYSRDLITYFRMEGAEPFKIEDLLPIFFQKGASVSPDPHYFHAHIWAFSRLMEKNPAEHVDVSSSYAFVGLLGCVTHVRYFEFNPPRLRTSNVEPLHGDLLALPLNDETVHSLSCLHAAEHVGLGRYGDTLDPLGTRKAARELTRVLAPGGELLFALPVGRPRVQFNGQRVHTGEQIQGYFQDLELLEFSGVDDQGNVHHKISLNELDHCHGGCGFFLFRKPKR